MRAIASCFLIVSAAALLSSPAEAGSTSALRKRVTLACPALGYTINCAISTRANPEFSSHCFVATPAGSHRLKPDYRFGYYDPIVSLQVQNGLIVTGQLTENATGRQSGCVQIGIGGG